MQVVYSPHDATGRLGQLKQKILLGEYVNFYKFTKICNKLFGPFR